MSEAPPAADRRLVADIGGTWARFALASAGGRLEAVERLPCDRFAGPGEAIESYLSAHGAEPRPRQAAIAVAAPVAGDAVTMTNRAWSFSSRDLRRAAGLERLEVFNDLEALARSLPALEAGDFVEEHPGRALPGWPIAALGVGTGLGIGAIVPVAGGWRALRTEGGHRDLAAASAREWEIVELLARRFGHVSAERAVSGPGLVHLLEALEESDGKAPSGLGEPAAVSRAAAAGQATAIEAVGLFSGWLGAVAGDLALTLGARGGVYLAGQMLAAMASTFDRARFRERYLAKGRFRAYVAEIPVRRVIHSQPVLLGAALALEDSLE